MNAQEGPGVNFPTKRGRCDGLRQSAEARFQIAGPITAPLPTGTFGGKPFFTFYFAFRF